MSPESLGTRPPSPGGVVASQGPRPDKTETTASFLIRPGPAPNRTPSAVSLADPGSVGRSVSGSHPVAGQIRRSSRSTCQRGAPGPIVSPDVAAPTTPHVTMHPSLVLSLAYRGRVPPRCLSPICWGEGGMGRFGHAPEIPDIGSKLHFYGQWTGAQPLVVKMASPPGAR